jgi:hypothetical protein
MGGKKPGMGYNDGTGTCQGGQAVWSLETRCGWYVDKVSDLRCGGVTAERVFHGNARQSINAGGGTGTRTSLQCPNDQAIYKVVVKSGDWLDSIEVFCRKP